MSARRIISRDARPRTPLDLTEHECINLRLPAKRGIYAWEFERYGRELSVRVDRRLVFNTASLMLKAAPEGFGLAYFTEQQVRGHLDSGALVRVLALRARSKPASQLSAKPGQ